jgi:dGTPase
MVLNDPAAESEILQKVSEWNGGKHTFSELAAALDRLRATKYWITTYSPTNDTHGHLKNLTSELIGRFVSATISAVVDTSDLESMSRYGSTLIVPDDIAAEISVLKGVVSAFLMTIESRQPYYEWQRGLLIELADAVLAANGSNLDPYCSSAWRAANSESEQRRVVVDQVASLTDQSAITLHHKLVASKQTTTI